MNEHDTSTDGPDAVLARYDNEVTAARDAYTAARMNAIAHIIRTSYPTATELVVAVGRHAAGSMVANPKAFLDSEHTLWDFARDGLVTGGNFAYLTLRLTDVHTDATHESLGPLRWYTDSDGALRAPLPPLPDGQAPAAADTGDREPLGPEWDEETLAAYRQTRPATFQHLPIPADDWERASMSAFLAGRRRAEEMFGPRQRGGSPVPSVTTEAAVTYFAQHGEGREPDAPLLVETFTSPAGWRTEQRPYRELTHDLVQELARAGVRAVLLSAHARHADFTIVPSGLLHPAYLT